MPAPVLSSMAVARDRGPGPAGKFCRIGRDTVIHCVGASDMVKGANRIVAFLRRVMHAGPPRRPDTT